MSYLDLVLLDKSGGFDSNSVMAEPQPQDVGTHLAKLVVDSTTGVDEKVSATVSAAEGEQTSKTTDLSTEDIMLVNRTHAVKTIDLAEPIINGATTDGDSGNDDKSTGDDKSTSTDSPTPIDGDQAKRETEKPVARTSSFKKPVPLKAMSLNKEFLASGTPPANRGIVPTKLSMSIDKGSKVAAPQQSSVVASAAPKPRLVGKIGFSASRPSALGTTSRKAGDTQPVWNKNQPVAPPPAKDLTDEELAKQFGIHMTSRLQSDDTSKESKWADIDDDDDDWQPDATIQWTDGSKAVVPQLEDGIDGSQDLQTPVDPKEPVDRRFAPSSYQREAPQNKSSQVPTTSEASRTGPWAPVPAGTFPTPRPMVEPPPFSMGLRMGQGDVRGLMSPSSAAKEVATDDFSRSSWRDKGSSQSRELFNSNTGKMEPVEESNRRKGSRAEPGPQRPSVLQRPHANMNGHPEPSAAFQQQRSSFRPDGERRRRASSTLSAGSGHARQMSLTSGYGGEYGRDNENNQHSGAVHSPDSYTSATRDSQFFNANQSTHAQSPNLVSELPNEAPIAPSVPAQPVEPAEDPIVVQKRVMKEASLLARQRRMDEEKAVEEARQERIRKKLADLGYTDSAKKPTEAVTAAKSPAPDASQVAPLATSAPVIDPIETPQQDNDIQTNASETIVPNSERIVNSVSNLPVISTSTLLTPAKPTISVSKEFPPEPWQASRTSNRGEWKGTSQNGSKNIWGPPTGEKQPRYAQNPLAFNGPPPTSTSIDSERDAILPPPSQDLGMSASNSTSKLSPGNMAPISQTMEASHKLSPPKPAQPIVQLPPTGPAPDMPALSNEQPPRYNPEQGFVRSNNNGSRYNSRDANPRERREYGHAQRNMAANRPPPDGIERDPRGRPVNVWAPTNVVGSQWSTAPDFLQKQEAMEKEERRKNRLAEESVATASLVAGNVETTAPTAAIDSVWRKVEVDENGRRKVVEVHHGDGSVEKVAPVSTSPAPSQAAQSRPPATSQQPSDRPQQYLSQPQVPPNGYAQANTTQKPVERSMPPRQQALVGPHGHYGPPLLGQIHHMPPGGPRSKFFPGGMEQYPKGPNGGPSEPPYPHHVEAHMTSPPFAQTQMYPMHGQPGSSVVVNLSQQPYQHSGYGPNVRQMQSPPGPAHQLPYKSAEGPTSPRSSNKSAFEQVQSRILKLAQTKMHSRESSADLALETGDMIVLTYDLGPIELETTSKPAYDISPPRLAKVSLPGSKVQSDANNFVSDMVNLVPEEYTTKENEEDLLAELFKQDFGSLPPICFPRVVPKALLTPAPVPDYSKAKKKKNFKHEGITTADVYTGPWSSEKGGKLTVPVKLDANAQLKEFHFNKKEFRRPSNPTNVANARRHSAVGFKGNGRDNRPPNAFYNAPGHINPLGQNHTYSPRNNMMHAQPRKMAGAV